MFLKLLIRNSFWLYILIFLIGCTPEKVPTSKWEQINKGIESVAILGLAVHPENVDRIVVLTRTGIYYSENRGEIWQQAEVEGSIIHSVNWGHLVSNSIWTDPKNKERLFTTIRGQVFKSDDFGKTWSNASGKTPNSTSIFRYGFKSCSDEIAGIYPHPNDEEIVYAGTITSGHLGGLLKTNNLGSGNSWNVVSGMSKCLCDKETSRTKRNTPNPYLHFTRTLTAPATIWPEGVSDGPNESSLTIDDCKTPVGSGMGNDAWPVAIHFENPEIMFASNAPYKGFKRSVNNGVIWEYYKKFSDEIVTTVVYNPSDHKNWIISGTGTWESFDTGESWSEPLDFPVVSLFQYDSEGHLWGLNNEGIHLRQKESSDWKKVNFVNNIIPKNIVVLYQDGHRYLVVGTEGSGLHLKKDAGDWSEISNTLPFDISVSSINFSNSGNTAVISVQMNSLYSLNKKKKEWTKLAHPIGRISDFDLLEDMSRIYYSGYSIYFWKTGTPSWKELDHGLGSEAWFTNVRISPIDPTIVYAVGMDKDGKYFFLKFIQKNGDHGKPVLKTPLVGTEIGNISFHSDNKKTIYLTSRSYLLKSLDEGKTWQKYPINPGNQGCNHVAGLILDPANTQEMYTTNNCSQLFYSSTEGEQWKELTPLRFPETSPTEEFGVNNFDIGLSKNKKVFAVYDINHISSNTGPVKYSLDDKKTWKDIDNSELPDGYDFMVIKSAKWNPEIIIAGDYSKGVFWRKIKEQ